MTPNQVVCLIDRQAAIVECVRANPDKPTIDACLAVVEGRHCEADALAAVKEVPKASIGAVQPIEASTDAGVEQ